MGRVFSIVTPLLLHMAVSECVAILFAGRMDVTSCTALTSILVIPAALWWYAKDAEWRGKTEKRSRGWCIAFGCFCLAGGGALNVVWSGIMNLFSVQDHFSNAAQESLLAAQAVVQVIGLGILVPAAEELIFRGLIYERMKRFFSVKTAVILSALLFAVYHGNPIQMIFAFPMAVVLAAVMEQGKSPVFPILFHMGANLAAVFVNLSA